MKAEKINKKQVSRTLVQKYNKSDLTSHVSNRIPIELGISSPIQMVTKVINHEVGYFYDDIYSKTKETVGTRVDVLLDPYNPRQGSEPGSDLTLTMWKINHHCGVNWVRGHLLNHNLGGPGIASNLYPISKSANSYHCQYVENKVINKLGEIEGNMENKEIYYSVKVTEAAHRVSNPKSMFTCDAYVIDKNNNKQEVLFKGINVISKPKAKPKPVLNIGDDACINNSILSRLRPAKRIGKGWSPVSKGKNSWVSYNWLKTRTKDFGFIYQNEKNMKRSESKVAIMLDKRKTFQTKSWQPTLGVNKTGLPDNLKAGIENLSGYSMDNVRVHYGSSKPAAVQAYAYTQGTDIYVAPGQERHLPHEAWHVAQQMAGRVAPTTEINGMPVNDNAALEHEADVMGAKANSY